VKRGLGLLRCREASELLSLGREKDLAPMKRISLTVHLAMCAHCRRFGRQVKLLGRAFRVAGDREG